MSLKQGANPVDPENSDILELIGRHSRSVESGVALGVHGTIRFTCFIDLLAAAHVERDVKLMSDAVVGVIRRRLPTLNATLVATPKRGNVLLGYEVAKQLDLRSIFARDEVLAGRHVEGIFDRQDRAILVDDVSSDGELLCDALYSLRQSGLFVEAAITVVNRSDGDAKHKLGTEGVRLISAMELNDAEIDNLIADQRAGLLTPRNTVQNQSFEPES